MCFSLNPDTWSTFGPNFSDWRIQSLEYSPTELQNNEEHWKISWALPLEVLEFDPELYHFFIFGPSGLHQVTVNLPHSSVKGGWSRLYRNSIQWGRNAEHIVLYFVPKRCLMSGLISSSFVLITCLDFLIFYFLGQCDCLLLSGGESNITHFDIWSYPGIGRWFSNLDLISSSISILFWKGIIFGVHIEIMNLIHLLKI